MDRRPAGRGGVRCDRNKTIGNVTSLPPGLPRENAGLPGSTLPRGGTARRPSVLHEPVMVPQVLSVLITDPAGLYIDGTLGTGGHAEAILRETAPYGRLWALEWDPLALDRARRRLEPFSARARFFQVNYAELPRLLAEEKQPAVGVLLDLGLSSLALDRPERGFSYRFPRAELDMRYDPGSGPSAAQHLSRFSETELADLLHRLGDVRAARRIARAVVIRRREQPLRKVGDLVAAVREGLGRPPSPRLLSQVFQAVRMSLHGDLENLEACLSGLSPHMVLGGRLAILCYQSLETRTVRRVLRPAPGSTEPVRWKSVLRRSLTPSPEEVRHNPRARRARLQAYERVEA
ncbi:MAG: 16S rRNA (cytosine(1402)-N(4))-methyltransferase RsmH [Candidatus Eisenbacteria bacterium]|nr:16S rRNA (cytosine(1402)-N(4))-methyltransferase RsmH [Candidatus Eisenbacteria bacterium]